MQMHKMPSPSDLNDNGIGLLSFCQAHNLVGSPLFPHKRIHKLTWNSPNGKTSNQIDHTLVNRKWRNSLKDVRVHRGADVGSDHNLAIPTIKLSLAALRRQKKQAKYDSAKLLEGDIVDCFDATIGGRFHSLAELDEEIADINEEWSNFTSAVNDAAKKNTLTTRRDNCGDCCCHLGRSLYGRNNSLYFIWDTFIGDNNYSHLIWSTSWFQLPHSLELAWTERALWRLVKQ